LDFYTKVLKNQSHWCRGTIYVDAFAGSGRAKIRRQKGDAATAGLFDEIEPFADPEADEYVRGSPRVALDLANRFTRYVFIERDANRAAELEKLRDEYGTEFSIEVRQGPADDVLDDLLRGDLGRNDFRSVVFLDPFGMQLSWSMIERLAQTKGIEVIINFALGMAIQRTLPRSADIPEGWRETLDRFFGTPAWFDQVYEEFNDLLGRKTRKRQDSGRRLLEWYRSRLKAAFGHVSTARLIRNTKGGHLYYLIWAGPHRTGLKGAQHILGKGQALP
jgi:three-Cys-motif partner protein